MVKRQRGTATGAGGASQHRGHKKRRSQAKGPLPTPQDARRTGDLGGNVPRSFILHSGAISNSVKSLLHDLRSTFEPYTASNLKQTKSNRLKDFINISGTLSVSHMMVLNQPGMQRKNKAKEVAPASVVPDAGPSAANDSGRVNLRIATLPRGPTITFRVNKYALRKDILHAQKRPPTRSNEFLTPPLLVLNNFSTPAQSSEPGAKPSVKGKEVQLMIAMFQNLFPPIHVQTMHLSSARRIVLLHYNAATKTIDWRHFVIQIRPVGVSRRLRRVVEGTTSRAPGSSTKKKSVPDLGEVKDISDYVLGRKSGPDGLRDDEDARCGFETDASTDAEDSDAEEDGGKQNTVDLFQRYMGKGNSAKGRASASGNQRAVRLREIGPRMELRLLKIEEGIGGDVLYHDYVRKSAAESAAQKRALNEAAKLKSERRQEQERNVGRKKAEQDARKTTAGRRGARDDAEADDETEDEETAAAHAQTDDEFDYEDHFADGVQQDDDEAGFPDAEEELFDDAYSTDNSESDVGAGSADSETDEEGDSDLSPIEITSNMEEMSDA